MTIKTAIAVIHSTLADTIALPPGGVDGVIVRSGVLH
jgi:hypothetical protein